MSISVRLFYFSSSVPFPSFLSFILFRFIRCFLSGSIVKFVFRRSLLVVRELKLGKKLWNIAQRALQRRSRIGNQRADMSAATQVKIVCVVQPDVCFILHFVLFLSLSKFMNRNATKLKEKSRRGIRIEKMLEIIQ